uniref:Non-specific lipid-transfer protein AP10 n=2 Tax=Cajanus cajan TaxID=3821 RepID=A0A151QMH0_CAJCA|nr:Non-specific lipid-transfer protein AP10 [Cajanus cajan]
MEEKKVTMALILMLVLGFGMVVTTLSKGEANGECIDEQPLVIHCVYYLASTSTSKPPAPAFCCEGVAAMFHNANTTQRKRTACKCLQKNAAFFHFDPEKVKRLPQDCNISSYFPIDPRENCDS